MPDNDNKQTNKRILIALDIDQMHLHDPTGRARARDSWIKSKQYWQDLYRQLRDDAQQQGYEVKFAIVTAKDIVDDLMQEQIKGFEEFLKDDENGNFKVKDGWSYAAVRGWAKHPKTGEIQDYIKYQSLTGDKSFNLEQGSTLVPNIETLFDQRQKISDKLKKSAAIERIAKAYDISLENCFMMDDSPTVHADMKNKGINCIEAAKVFNKYNSEAIPKRALNQVLGEKDKLDMSSEIESPSCDLGKELADKFYKGLIYQDKHDEQLHANKHASPPNNNPEAPAVAPAEIEHESIEVTRQPSIPNLSLTLLGKGNNEQALLEKEKQNECGGCCTIQ